MTHRACQPQTGFPLHACKDASGEVACSKSRTSVGIRLYTALHHCTLNGPHLSNKQRKQRRFRIQVVKKKNHFTPRSTCDSWNVRVWPIPASELSGCWLMRRLKNNRHFNNTLLFIFGFSLPHLQIWRYATWHRKRKLSELQTDTKTRKKKRIKIHRVHIKLCWCGWIKARQEQHVWEQITAAVTGAGTDSWSPADV